MSSAIQVSESAQDVASAQDRPKILVVDDVAVERRFVGGLAERGARVRVLYASDGVEAMEMIERESPAVVLTDLQMPNMDGLQLVEAIRKQHPRLPVVLITAHGSEGLSVRALQSGATSYVPKRDLARDLVPTLNQILTATAAGNRRRRLLGYLEERESRYRLENEPEMINEMIGLLGEEFDTVGFGDASTRVRMTVAMQEALSNALYHGNLEVSSDLRQEDERHFHELARHRRAIPTYRDRRILVRVKVGPNEALFNVIDEGPGFDTSRLDRPIDPEDMMRIGGRGLLLIRAFMDEVHFNKKGNEITMIKRCPSSNRPA